MAIILPQSIGMLIGASFFALRKTKSQSGGLEEYIIRIVVGNGKCLYVDNSSTDRTGRGFLAVTDGDYYLYTGGIFLLGRKNQKEFKYVVFGCLLVIFGGILLGYMKAA